MKSSESESKSSLPRRTGPWSGCQSSLYEQLLAGLKPGVYVLTATIQNPSADRRVRRDWRAEVSWDKGEKFLIEPWERGPEGEGVLLMLRRPGAYHHFGIPLHKTNPDPRAVAIVERLVIDESPQAQWSLWRAGLVPDGPRWDVADHVMVGMLRRAFLDGKIDLAWLNAAYQSWDEKEPE